jgi:hypothetical protein
MAKANSKVKAPPHHPIRNDDIVEWSWRVFEPVPVGHTLDIQNFAKPKRQIKQIVLVSPNPFDKEGKLTITGLLVATE